jgi:hypothetical protein
MFVSTKNLSFMELVAGLGWRKTQIVAFANPGDGAVLCLRSCGGFSQFLADEPSKGR